MVYKLHIIL